MGLAEIVAKMRFSYHANAIEVNNVLNQLGIRNDEKAEAIAKNHTMMIMEDILPRLGYDVEKYLQQKSEG